MALRVVYIDPYRSNLGYSVERLADGLLWDFAVTGPTPGIFAASPTTTIKALTNGTGVFAGRHRDTLTPTVEDPAKFVDGGYLVTIHDLSAGSTPIDALYAEMHDGDDAPVFSSGGGGGGDSADVILSKPVPGTYPVGSIGYIIGTNLDQKVSEVATGGIDANALAAEFWKHADPASFTIPGSGGSLVVLAANHPTIPSIPSANDVAAAVWLDAVPGHFTPAGSAGAMLASAAIGVSGGLFDAFLARAIVFRDVTAIDEPNIMDAFAGAFLATGGPAERDDDQFIQLTPSGDTWRAFALDDPINPNARS